MKTTAHPVVVTAVAVLALLGCERESSTQGRRSTSPAPDSAGVAAASTPVRSGYVEVNGARHYYQVRGDLKSGKTPLLVLHGALMSADAMALLAERFAGSRPVIALDARGHGRTPDIAGPITYELLADDAAGVLAALGVRTADVLGYSMGGTTAIVLAIRHPERVNKLIPISGPYSYQGLYPEVRKAFEQWSPTMLAGSGLEAEYKRLSPTPDGLPALITKLKVLVNSPYGWPEARIRELDNRTMVVVGDADGIQLEHAIKLFVLRGGGDRQTAANGFLAEAPRARLAVLPGTSHVGMMARPQLIVDVVTPFLDDETPPMPGNFLQPGPGEVPAAGPKK
jgi:pimeloyl-ACP methyl ester carboxylesterase